MDIIPPKRPCTYVVSFNPLSTVRSWKMEGGVGGRKMGGRKVFQCCLVKDPVKRSWKIFGLARENIHLLSRGRLHSVGCWYISERLSGSAGKHCTQFRLNYSVINFWHQRSHEFKWELVEAKYAGANDAFSTSWNETAYSVQYGYWLVASWFCMCNRRLLSSVWQCTWQSCCKSS
jgi:hypothetical protein